MTVAQIIDQISGIAAGLQHKAENHGDSVPSSLVTEQASLIIEHCTTLQSLITPRNLPSTAQSQPPKVKK